MRKIFILIIIGILMFPLASKAGIYGTLKGKVVDEEGKPMIGATVKIIGTSRGTYVRDKDGGFIVTNIQPGSYDVSVTAVGKAKYLIKVRINSDETTEISVKLAGERIETKTIEVIGTKEMVSKYTVGTDRKVSSEQIQSVAREGIQGVISLTAGVYTDNSGFYIRGSRPEETQVRVDGMEVGNQFTGGYGLGGINYFPMASAYATDQVDVKTGGFSAEYGGTIGGIVNSVLKTGRTDRYEGFLRYRTDVGALWGSQKNDLQIVQLQDRLGYTLSGPGNKLEGPQQNRIEYGIGGPLPLLTNSTFYLTGVYMHENYRQYGYQIYDPVDLNNPTKPQNNLGQLTDNQTYLKNITGRISLGISNDIKLTLGGSFGMANFELYNQAWLYAYDNGVINGVSNNVPEGYAKDPAANTLVLNFFAKINHQLNSKSYYEFTVSNTTNSDEFAKRKTFGDPGFFTGYDLWYPQDIYKVDGSAWVSGSDKIIDEFATIPIVSLTKDGYLKIATRGINPLTGYIEGGADATGTNNPYGLQQFNYIHGNDRTFQFRKSQYWEFDGNYTLAIDGEFSHMFKTGFEFRTYQLRYHMNSLPWDANPFYDVYTDQWGGNIYATDSPTTYAKTSQPYKPYEGALFVQDQISYKGIIIEPGLRLDFYNPNSEYRVNPYDFVSISADSGFATASLKAQLSPRINVTYPITERSNVTIGYSVNFQRPTLERLYDGFNIYQLRGNSQLGDPNMKAQRTNAFQAIYNNQISDNFALDVTAYYKDIYNQLGTQYVPAVPIPYFQYVVSEFGSAKGIEIQFRKTPTSLDHIGFDLNYTLSSANGTSSSPDGNYLLALDPFTNKPSYALLEYPMPWDRTHVINGNLYFVWADQQGPSIGGIQPLENSQISFTTIFRTGTPYTPLDYKGRAVGDINSARQPAWWRTDMRFIKSFLLKDWFGESMGNASLDFAVDIINLFNNRQVQGVNARTGDPNDNGTSFYTTAGNFSSTAWYKDANFGIPETFASSQYDNFGNRLYNVNADFDNNGIVTQSEKLQAYEKYLQVALRGQGNNMAPIQVWFTVMLRFN